jgi:hypothetical protein
MLGTQKVEGFEVEVRAAEGLGDDGAHDHAGEG